MKIIIIIVLYLSNLICTFIDATLCNTNKTTSAQKRTKQDTKTLDNTYIYDTEKQNG